MRGDMAFSATFFAVGLFAPAARPHNPCGARVGSECRVGAARDLPSLAARSLPSWPADAVDVAAADVFMRSAARPVVLDQGRRGASAGVNHIHVGLGK